MNRKIFVAVAMLSMLSAQAVAQEVKTLPVAVKPGNENLVLVGRFTDDFTFDWSGCSVRFKFKGTAANVLLKTCRSSAGLQVVVDGKPTRTLITNKNQERYALAADLENKEHSVEIFKRTEGFLGQLRFEGLQLSEGAALLPSKMKERKIMVLGDSITCGYANEEPDLKKGNTSQNENGYMSYAPVAARELDAEIMMICCSGRGIYRNRDMQNDRNGVIPELFEQTLFLNKATKWDHTKYIPHAIVINLGTNDFEDYKGKKQELTKENFLGAYRTFIKRLREVYPDAKIIASIGPMRIKPVSTWLAELETEFKGVISLVYPRKNGKQYLGGHWHPSVEMDKEMAKPLVAKLRQICDWK